MLSVLHLLHAAFSFQFYIVLILFVEFLESMACVSNQLGKVIITISLDKSSL
jgi:hypothetical protein